MINPGACAVPPCAVTGNYTKKVIKIKQTKKLPEMANKTINTMIGLAIYLCTEFEDENGNFNDDYYTSSGYFLIHQGDKHHVYKV